SLASGSEATYPECLTQLNSTSRQLFVGAPNFNAVHQGALGDASFLAALSLRTPLDICRMIQENPDGCTVTFRGVAHAVQVSALTDAQIAGGSSARQNGLWLSVLEQA